MGAAADYLRAYREMGLGGLSRRVYDQVNEDGILTWAAALAYSWMFALFPLVIFLLTLLAFLPVNTDRMVQEVNRMISGGLPGEASKLLTDQVPGILKAQRGGLLTVGALLTLWAASGGMAMTMSALNRCYDIVEDQPFYVARPKAILMTLMVLVLLLVVLAVLPVGGLVLAWAEKQGWLEEWGLSVAGRVGLDVLRWAVAVGVMFLVVGLIYYLGPRVKQGFRFVTPGGAVCVLGWIVLGYGFKLYITRFGGSYGETYGTVGGAVILLLFLYLCSLMLLVGAEINSEFDFALYGRTGGLSAKPGEMPGTATPEAEAKAEPAPKAAATVPPGPGTTGVVAASDAGETGPRRTAVPVHIEILPVGATRGGERTGAKRAGGKRGLVLAVVGAVAGVAGYLLHRPGRVYTPRLTPRRRLRKVYPVTYAAIKTGV